MKLFFSLRAYVYVVLLSSSLAFAEPQSTYRTAYDEVLPWPIIAKVISIDEAYKIQMGWVSQLLEGEHPVAFKRGLSSKASLDSFALADPVFGVLPSASRFVSSHSEKVRISRAAFIKPVIELELGLMMLVPVSKPFASFEEFVAAVGAFKPAIELPDLGFEAKPNGVDVIASNVAARYYIEKSGMCMDIEKIEEIPVTLSINGKNIFNAVSGDILDGQLKAGYKMANHLLEQGWSLRSGQVLLTGSIGPVIPAEVGEYTASFGEYGEITFVITD